MARRKTNPNPLKRGVAQESKVPEQVINHFDEFCKFVRGQEWLSLAFGTELILKFMAAQKDAYERGEQHGRNQG